MPWVFVDPITAGCWQCNVFTSLITVSGKTLELGDLISSLGSIVNKLCTLRKKKKRQMLAESCPTLCDAMDCSLPGYSAHGSFQARILEQVAISYSRGSSRPRDRSPMSCIGRWILYHCTIWETLYRYLVIIGWMKTFYSFSTECGPEMQQRPQ